MLHHDFVIFWQNLDNQNYSYFIRAEFSDISSCQLNRRNGIYSFVLFSGSGIVIVSFYRMCNFAPF